MWYLRIILISLCTLSLGLSCQQHEKGKVPNQKEAQQQGVEVLLVGTFHYNNPGADVVKTKTFDILKEKSQLELELISKKIKEFNPSKIFVEWNYKEQVELDSLYKLYQNDTYFEQDSLSSFYEKNEIFQLAFRAAKKNDLDQVYGIDYLGTEFPFDSVMTIIGQNSQAKLQSRIGELIETFTSGFDDRISSGTSLVDLTYYLNSSELRQLSNEFHSEIPLSVGDENNFIGPFLTSEWYKRNIYMWSLVQKYTDENDQRIMVLVGASHAAVMEQMINQRENWNVVELKAILQ